MGNRIIKFRAWEEKYKCMYYNHSVNISIDGEVSFLDKHGDWLRPEEGQLILMQFTGLLDKNGKEIYEGDMLGLDDPEDKSKCVVVFEKGAFKKQFTAEDGEVFCSHFERVDLEIWEVIGSIHQTPDLL